MLISRKKYMLLALEESRKAYPKCLPNPPVGCVLVCNGEIIYKGHTQLPGIAHAEVDAFSKLTPEENLHVEVYVTLEPCSFHGRTPSCAKMLLEKNVKAVYVATLDPHPKNRGAGIEILRAGGIPVEVGIAESEVLEFLGPYLIKE